MFPLQSANSATGYFLQRSLRFRASADPQLNRTPATTSGNQTWTYSAWVKRGALGTTQCILAAAASSTEFNELRFNTDDTFVFTFVTGGADFCTLKPSQVFRDPSAWYHIVVMLDTTQATASNRAKIYVNGAQVTAFSTATYPSLNQNWYINQNVANRIGSNPQVSGRIFDGYLAEINMVSGQALTPSSFGSTNSTTGVWQPARYTGTYGTNGFYLPFTDNSALTTSSNVGLGKDFSGNGNYWTTNNISITAGVTYDSMTDVPTLTSATAANYAVWNPLYQPSGSGAAAFSNGNLLATPVSAAFDNVGSSILMPATGYWYAEFTGSGASIAGNTNMIGVVGQSDLFAITAANFVGFTVNSYGYLDTGNLRNNNTTSQTVAAMGTNPVVMVALGNGKLWWGLNGTWLGTGSPNPATATAPAYSGLTGNYGFAATSYNTTGGLPWAANFGQRPFTYTPPSGFVALNSFNLPDSTIKQGNKVMDATTYLGNGTARSITNAAGFKPDFVWYKDRSNGSFNHGLTDSVRGVTKFLSSNSTNAESTISGVTSFNSDGFSIGTDAGGNTTGDGYVAWQWQAGQGSSSSNTSGSITSTVSVNASAGFSVVTYTGTGANATVGHGLGVAPSMMIVKNRTSANGWVCYHTYDNASPASGYMRLDSTAAFATDATAFNNTAPISSVFSLGILGGVNTSTNAYVAYCWSEIAGYSKFGSYTGNGSADGPFVYTGFRPKFIMYKSTNVSNNWVIFDTSRDIYNVVSNYLLPNSSAAEAAVPLIDFVSNGFKIRTVSGGTNGSGDTMIYACFAENPFKNSLAR